MSQRRPSSIWGNSRVILGSYWDNGKDDGNHNLGSGFRVLGLRSLYGFQGVHIGFSMGL